MKLWFLGLLLRIHKRNSTPVVSLSISRRQQDMAKSVPIIRGIVLRAWAQCAASRYAYLHDHS